MTKVIEKMIIDLNKKILNKNKLWVKWKTVDRIGDGRIQLNNVEMYGPVTQDYIPLEPKGELRLDFTNHFILRLDNYYIVSLTWESVKSQEQGSIKFKKVTLEDKNVGLLDKIKNSDLLLIDCGDHTELKRNTGQFKMVYPSMLFNELQQPYDFSI